MRAKVDVTWKKIGNRKRIKVPKRLQSVEELTQLKKQADLLLEQENANKPPPQVSEIVVDMRTPEEKLMAAKSKLKNLKTINSFMGGAAMKKSLMLKKAAEEEEVNKEADEAAENNGSGGDFFAALLKAKVRARTQAYAKIAQEEEEKANRKPGVRDWPAWLTEFSKTRLDQARNARMLHTQTVRCARDPDAEQELRFLQKKAKSHELPRLTYRDWSKHVPMPPDEREWSVKPNLRIPGDYFKMDSIGWTPEDKYILALKSPIAAKYMESVYVILQEFLVPASKDGDKKLGIGEKVKVLELGSGSGEHAVVVCKRNSDVLWQPTDVSEVCVDSINKRAKLCKVLKGNTPQSINGNCCEAFKFNVLYYEKAFKELDNKWRSVDVLVALNVIQYTPFRFVENMFKAAKEVVKLFGYVFVYGPFRVDGQLAPDQELQDVNIRKLSAKLGIRDLEDVVAIAGQYTFQLELKFDLEGGNIALIFKKIPPNMAKETSAEVKEDAEGDKEELEEEKNRTERKSMKQKLTQRFRDVKNMTSMFRKTGFFRKTISEKKNGVSDGESEDDNKTKDVQGESEKRGAGESDADSDGKARIARKSKKNPRRRVSKEDSSGSESDQSKGSKGQRKSRATRATKKNPRKTRQESKTGRKKDSRDSREQQRADRKSRMTRATKGKKEGKLSEKAAQAKADALAEAAMSKFL